MKSGLRTMFTGTAVSRRRRVALVALSLLAAAGLWLPCLHLAFAPDLRDWVAAEGVAPKARALAARHLALWTDPALKAEELRKMRGSNAEWDFMGRTYLVLALANMGLREPAAKDRYLAVIDAVIDDTLATEREKGLYHFLMDYARAGVFVSQPPHSLFLDGEIALMLAARRTVEDKPDYRTLLAARIDKILAHMRRSPVLSAESYPDECWTFCNTIALASIRMADALDGTDRSEFITQWLATAKQKLLDPATGLLVSSYMFDGTHSDGPEGSTIWMAAHCLELIDADFARDQYARARRELGRSVLGFAYAREWPTSWQGPPDIDSGPIVPLLEASPGASGQAVLGAAAFGDRPFLASLLSSLDAFGFPRERNGALKYCASNQVGDAVILYAIVQGPLWKKVKEARKP